MGSGVNKENVLEILDKTKVHQVHSSCKDWIEDVTTSMHDVSFAYAPFPHENDYEIVSEELVKTLLDVIKSSHFFFLLLRYASKARVTLLGQL